MGTFQRRIQNFRFLLKNHRFDEIGRKLRLRLYSDTRSYGLKRDLAIPLKAPTAQIPIVVRPLQECDIAKIFDLESPGLSREEIKELIIRMEHLEADIPTCYVAVDQEGKPAYMQWLMGSEEDEKIQEFFNGTFPHLRKGEAILENAYTLTDFRGKGIMAAAMAQIAERGKEIGASTIITFVEEHNTASLKGCKRSGFVPYLIRRERWFLFRRRLSFQSLPEGTPYPFDVQSPVPVASPTLAAVESRLSS